MRYGIVLLIVILGVCSVCIPLGYPQTLKVDVNLVSIFATVKDEAGNFVTDLGKADFRVYEDNQPQEIQIFEKQDRVDSSIGILMDASGSMVDIMPYRKRRVHECNRALPNTCGGRLSSFY